MTIDVQIRHDPDNNVAYAKFAETRVDYLENPRTGDRVSVPYDFADSIALANYAIREGDAEIGAADEAIAAGKMKPEERPVFATQDKRPIIGYRVDDYTAALQERLDGILTKSHAEIVASLVAQSDQVVAAQAALAADRALFATEAAAAAAAVQTAQEDLASREAKLASDRAALDNDRAVVQEQARQVLAAQEAISAAHAAITAAAPAALDRAP